MGVRFLTRSRLVTDEESLEMVIAVPPQRGTEAAGLAQSATLSAFRLEHHPPML